MNSKMRPRKRGTTKDMELQKELKEFIQDLQTSEGLLFMALLDDVLPRLHEIHETLHALNKEIDEKLIKLERL